MDKEGGVYMSHLHEIVDSDSHFIIDPITRQITTDENNLKTELIQYDHNSERYSFELPRYIEGHDMTLCNVVQVHYSNIASKTKESKKDIYNVSDLQCLDSNENTLIFSWLISGNATQLVGKLNFVIRFSCISDTTIDYVWQTDIYDKIKIKSAIYNTDYIATEYSDVLAEFATKSYVDSLIGGIENGTY